MSVTQKALWIIERNMDQPLTLAGIARDCGVSRSHLAHAFVAATGRPVVTYLRGRRLTHAAATLAKGAPDILRVALDAGYNSHEAFTRAFREQFGAAPETVRERASTETLPLTLPIELRRFEPTRLASPRIVDEPRILVVGLSGAFPDGLTAFDIPALWQRFVPFMADIPARKQAMPIGVTRDANDNCGFEYIAGLEVERFGDLPKELTPLEIPARTYAVFSHDSHIARLPETYAAIWDEALSSTDRAALDAPVLERHKPTFDPRTGEGGVEVWIPLES